MTLDDVREILGGPDDAATQFFRRQMSPGLKAEMKPVVDDSLARVGAIQTYEQTVGDFSKVPLVPNLKADLTDHVLELGLDGIFHYLAVEEAAIRNNPAKRTTELLQKCSQISPRRTSAEIASASMMHFSLWGSFTASRTPEQGHGVEPKRFVIVDDDRLTAGHARAVLEKAGHSATVYDSSIAGLEAIRESPPDAVLTDVMMPEMDGMELTQRLREDPALNDLKIFVFSGKAFEYDRVRAMELGADAYILKPIKAESFLATVREHSWGQGRGKVLGHSWHPAETGS